MTEFLACAPPLPKSRITVFIRVIHAWDMVDQRVIITSFLKTGISNALDSSEDDALWHTEENVDEESESEEDYSSEEESNDA